MRWEPYLRRIEAPEYRKAKCLHTIAGIPPFGFLRMGPFGLIRAHSSTFGLVDDRCNDAFGWRTDETGSGHLWINNAKENPLTEWVNDPLAVTGPERVLFSAGGGEVSCFAAPDGLPCTVTYGFGEAMWEKHVAGSPLRCTAFVPPDEDARYLLLEAAGRDRRGDLSSGGEQRSRRWPIQGNLCLRTVPAPGGRWPETGPADFNRARERLERTRAWWSFQRKPFDGPDAGRGAGPLSQRLGPLSGDCLPSFRRDISLPERRGLRVPDPVADVCAVLLTAPVGEAQILRACAHQYEEGDVQHWWHPAAEGETGSGVRTRISDDLLWLPYVLCEYLEKTGDRDILRCRFPSSVSPTLAENEQERYEAAETSAEKAGVLEHARRAVEQALRQGAGPHGLCKDGDRRLERRHGPEWEPPELGRACGSLGFWRWYWSDSHLSAAAKPGPVTGGGARYASAANAAWDGEWFLRGWYDDGQTLGASADQACRIDSIAQSFAVLCPLGDRDRHTGR